MKTINLGIRILSVFLLAGFLTGPLAYAEVAKLAKAPNVPDPLKRSKAETVVINLQAKEYVGNLTDDVKYNF
ncbi:MAG: hypothetical protein VW455_06855 [Nitrospinota bacterium]